MALSKSEVIAFFESLKDVSLGDIEFVMSTHDILLSVRDFLSQNPTTAREINDSYLVGIEGAKRRICLSHMLLQDPSLKSAFSDLLPEIDFSIKIIEKGLLAK